MKKGGKLWGFVDLRLMKRTASMHHQESLELAAGRAFLIGRRSLQTADVILPCFWSQSQETITPQMGQPDHHTPHMDQPSPPWSVRHHTTCHSL